MCRLLILGEDHRYNIHPGVDPIAICRALWRTYFCRRPEGGSTIAMQLVRTISGRYEKTPTRKILEIVLAVRLTKHVDRERLPCLYLWVAYYGWRMNNFLQACDRLSIDPNSSSLEDAAQLVARLKYPEPRISNLERKRKIEVRCAYLANRYRNRGNRLRTELAGSDGTVQSTGATGKIN
jgi:membrane carboxypeptidase/penicillin-binding protein PbpC